MKTRPITRAPAVRRYPDVRRDSMVYRRWAQQAKCVFARTLAGSLKEKPREREELLAVGQVVHIVPRVKGAVAVCREEGPFRVFFTHDGLEECPKCYAARPDAASPREALVAFFGGEPPTVYRSYLLGPHRYTMERLS